MCATCRTAELAGEAFALRAALAAGGGGSR